MALAAPAAATKADVSEKILDTYLRSNGYPEEMIEQMDYEWKLDSFQRKGQFMDATSELGSLLEDTDSVTTQSFQNYVVWWYAERVQGPLPTHTYLRLTYRWVWLFTPSFTLTDKIGIKWTPGWAPMNGSQVCEYEPVDAYGNSKLFPGSQDTHTGDTFGAAYKFDLLNSFTIGQQLFHTEYNRGKVSVIVAQATNGRAGMQDYITCLGNYFHKELGFAGLVSIGSDGNWSVNIANPTTYKQSGGITHSLLFTWGN